MLFLIGLNNDWPERLIFLITQQINICQAKMLISEAIVDIHEFTITNGKAPQ